jgi:hypothetical protein
MSAAHPVVPSAASAFWPGAWRPRERLLPGVGPRQEATHCGPPPSQLPSGGARRSEPYVAGIDVARVVHALDAEPEQTNELAPVLRKVSQSPTVIAGWYGGWSRSSS